MKTFEKFLFRVASQICQEAKAIAPYRTHNLRRDIQVFDHNISKGEVEIGNTLLAPYASFVHEGTGIYGKHKSHIIPRKKKALKTPYGFFKSVKGQKAQPYLQDAAKKVLTQSNLNKMTEDIMDDLASELTISFKRS